MLSKNISKVIIIKIILIFVFIFDFSFQRREICDSICIYFEIEKEKYFNFWPPTQKLENYSNLIVLNFSYLKIMSISIQIFFANKELTLVKIQFVFI